MQEALYIYPLAGCIDDKVDGKIREITKNENADNDKSIGKNPRASAVIARQRICDTMQ